jgi:hypothetical protein
VTGSAVARANRLPTVGLLLVSAILGLAVLAAISQLAAGDDQPVPQLEDFRAALVPSTSTPQIAAGSSGSIGVVSENDERSHSGNTRIWPWDETDVLMVVEEAERTVRIDLAVGQRRTLANPDTFVDQPLIRVADGMVAVGKSGAWWLNPELSWEYLGSAQRTRPSTRSNLVWLGVPRSEGDPLTTEFLWSEVDMAGVVQRIVYRTGDPPFGTPELAWRGSGDIAHLTDQRNPWRSFTGPGTPLALGRNDLITIECQAEGCRRAWYDLESGVEREPIFADLAGNVSEIEGPVLSADGHKTFVELSPAGRFAAAPELDGTARIQSVATGELLATGCLWQDQPRWTSSEDLVACTTEAGIEMYETRWGEAMGIAHPRLEQHWARFVFVPGDGARNPDA